jgi:hypothetical protein
MRAWIWDMQGAIEVSGSSVPQKQTCGAIVLYPFDSRRGVKRLHVSFECQEPWSMRRMGLADMLGDRLGWVSGGLVIITYNGYGL